MAQEHLVIEWDLPHLYLLRAEKEGSGWSITDWSRQQLPDHLVEQGISGSKVAEWLIENGPEWIVSLAESDTAIPLSIVLPRDRVTLRKLELPPMPVEELPGVVPLQMASQLAMRADELTVDFLPPLSPVSGEPQIVQAFSIPADQHRLFQAFAEKTHASLEMITLSSLALQEAIVQMTEGASSPSPTVTSLIAPDRIETILTNHNQLVTAGFRRRNSESVIQAREVAAEVRRLLATENVAETPRFQLLAMSGIGGEQLKTELESKLDQTVEGLTLSSGDRAFHLAESASVNSLQELYAEGAAVCLGGLLTSTSPQITTLNLHKPREMGERKDHRKVWTVGALAGVTGGLILAYLAWWGHLAGLQDEIDRVQAEIKTIDEFLDKKGELVTHARRLRVYEDRSLDPADHFQKMFAALPPRDQLLLTEWSSLPLSGSSHTRIRTSGLSRNRQQIESFADRLASHGWTVGSPTIRMISEQGKFEYEFDLDFEIPAPESATTSGRSLRVSDRKPAIDDQPLMADGEGR